MRMDWRNWNFIAWRATKRAVPGWLVDATVCVCVNRTNWDARPNVREHWTTSFSVLALRSFAWLLPLRFGFRVWDTFGRIRSTLYYVDLGVGIFSDLAKRNFLYLIWKFISLLVAALISCRRVGFMLRLLVPLVRLHFTNELHRLRRKLRPPVAAKTLMAKRKLANQKEIDSNIARYKVSSNNLLAACVFAPAVYLGRLMYILLSIRFVGILFLMFNISKRYYLERIKLKRKKTTVAAAYARGIEISTLHRKIHLFSISNALCFRLRLLLLCLWINESFTHIPGIGDDSGKWRTQSQHDQTIFSVYLSVGCVCGSLSFASRAMA